MQTKITMGLTAWFLCGWFSLINAQTIAGGELGYRYIGDSTGVPHHFLLELTVYREAQDSLLISPFDSIQVHSTCYGSQNIAVQRFSRPSDSLLPDGGTFPREYGACADRSDSNFVALSVHRYQGDVLLSGPCHDFSFSWQNCCRPGNILNLDSTAGRSIYLQAQMNYVLGPNNTPRHHFSLDAFCVQQKAYWPQAAVDEDSDSLQFGLALPRDAAGSSIHFASGYSFHYPFITNVRTPINLNTPRQRFQSMVPGQVNIRWTITEYRYDTSTGWLTLATSDRELPYYFTQNCSISPSWRISARDSISAEGGFTKIPCPLDTLWLESSEKILCESLSADASDFSLFRFSDTMNVPVVAAGSDSCFNGYTQRFWLVLHQSINKEEDLLLTTKSRHSILIACDLPWPNFADTLLLLRTVNCPGTSLPETDLLTTRPYPNPTSAELTLEIARQAPVDWAVLDANARTVGQGRSEGRLPLQIELPGPPGLYLLRIRQGQHRQTYLVQKE